MDNVVADVQAKFVGVQETPIQILKRLLFFSSVMILGPLFSYFFSKSVVFEGMFSMSSNNSYFYAAIVTIVSVHISLGIFIYEAFKESPSKPARKVD